MQKAPRLLPHANSGEGGCDIEFSAQFIMSNADANTEEAERAYGVLLHVPRLAHC